RRWCHARCAQPGAGARRNGGLLLRRQAHRKNERLRITMRPQDFILRSLRTLILIVFVLFAAFPIYWMLNTATTDPDTLYRAPQSLLPALERLPTIFTVFSGDSMLARWMMNSAFIAMGTTVLSLLLAITTAYALSRYTF